MEVIPGFLAASDNDWLQVLLTDLDTPRSLTVSLLADYREWDQLVSLKTDPNLYLSHDADGFRRDYHATELLRKCAELPIETDPKATCLDSFYKAERMCLATNARLRRLTDVANGDWFSLSPKLKNEGGILRVVRAWRKITQEILGSLPDTLEPKFSSGSTYNDRYNLLPQDKMSSQPTVSLDAYNILEPIWTKSLWQKGLAAEQPNRSSPEIVRGNRFSMVPKTALTHRGICIEPSLNITYQLSVGSVMRRALRRQGIDLKFGQPVHQSLAESASKTLDVGTIDLSMASDTVSFELVKLILPREWFELLDALRSKSTLMPDGQWLFNQKFSSMGCGFTFELETLLFFGLAKALELCCGRTSKVLKVYGDDIICDSWLCTELLPALSFFGFTANSRKTYFGDTPFRESCGADFFAGLPVRGHYLENFPREPQDWIALCNGLRRMAGPDLDRFIGLDRYKRAWLRAKAHIPKHLRSISGPACLGDAVIHDNPDTWKVRNGPYGSGDWRRLIRVLVPCFSATSSSSYDRKFWTRDSIMAAVTLGCLAHCGDSQKFDGKVWTLSRGKQMLPRREPDGYKVRWIQVSAELVSHRSASTGVDKIQIEPVMVL